jgi:type I restriction enzyme, S subunit
MNWSETTIRLGDVAKVISGYAFSSADFQKFGVPVVKIANVRLGYVDLSETQFVDPSFLRLDTKYHVKRGDILISLTGSHLTQPNSVVGRVALFRPSVDNCLLNQRVGKIIIRQPQRCHARFLFYALSAPEKLRTIATMAQGAASQANVSPTQVESIGLSLPCIQKQRQIASILSAYDDLIENNARRIKILEDMAQMLYREWFVNFRFPGHENVRMVESELGPIPEGWSAKCVTDAVFVNPATTVRKEGVKTFLPMGSLSQSSMLINDFEEREGNSGAKFKNGDTLFARITPCLENGKTGFVQFLPSDDAVAFGSTEFIVLRSKTVCPEYVYLMARSSEFRDNAIKSMSGATGRQRVQEACFNRFFIAQPDSDTLVRFTGLVGPIFRLIQSLSSRNLNLRTTRGFLLPKLISGEVPVEAADEAAAELIEQTA